MNVAEALARRSEQARAVFYSVTAYRHISNVTIERAVELHMTLHGIDMARFDAVMEQYRSCVRDARGIMEIPGQCKDCPEG